ncbi:MAG: DUF2062 domain-containing protein [Gammaproteobacteria bacterium]|jgi:uncharacterized protein (DUF2062 family)
MPKKLLKKVFPAYDSVRDHKHLQFFGTLLHDPNLWHMNRHSVSGAFAVGLFMAFVPVPFQMVGAAALAILFRVNLPISVLLVWLTNPVTMGPVFFFAYKLGRWILDAPPLAFHFQLSLDWLMHDMVRIWKPFLLGCLLFSVTGALVGYYGMLMFWRLHVGQRWQERKRRRLASRSKHD